MEAVRREVPATAMRSDDLGDPVDVLVSTGLASSRSDARRLLEQRAIRANGTQIESGDDFAEIAPLHGRYVLLRKGKQTYHMVEISPRRG